MTDKKTNNNSSCPKQPTDFDIGEYAGTPMSDWFSPSLLIKTGLRTIASTLFSAYSDKRTLLAAVNDAKPFTKEWSGKDSVCVDYVADLGDGWDSTYSVAWSLAQPELDIPEGDTPLRRGDILVMGGDQVYPYASEEEYKLRMVRPYQSALPCSSENDAPTVFAIPGNHDWYDGLTGFMRRFGQGGWLGGWRTRQHRSYWAVQLPHRWWIWGIDTQLDAYVDHAQTTFFRKAAEEHMKEGDRVILCVAEPSWIFANNGDSKLHRNISFMEEKIIEANGGHLSLTLSGDLHHYAHYVEQSPKGEVPRHKVTCGGGGAFTHGTHHLPDVITLNDGADTFKSTGMVLPDKKTSKTMLWRNLFFPLKHPLFAAVLAGFYLVYAWVLNRTLLLPKLSAVPFVPENIEQVPVLFFKETITSVMAMGFLALLILSGVMFAQPNWKSCPSKKSLHKWLGGMVHALLHLVVLLGCLWYVATESWITIPPDPPYWGSAAWFSIIVALVGGLVGGWVFGVYLLFSNLWFGFHRTEAASAVADKDSKSFLRIVIDKGGAVIYAIGLKNTGRRWRWKKDAKAGESWVELDEEKLNYHLIESWKIQ
jgi:hypothetical protein